MVCGDFNIISDPEDKIGGWSFVLNKFVVVFRDIISKSELLDLGYKGPRFTWSNNQKEGVNLDPLRLVATLIGWGLHWIDGIALGGSLNKALEETNETIFYLELKESDGLLSEDEAITLQRSYNKLEALNRQNHLY